MGFDEETAQKMYLAGALHDIGKVAVGNEILEKPGRLTDEEFAVMKHHAAYTYQILSDIEDFNELRDWAGVPSRAARRDRLSVPQNRDGAEPSGTHNGVRRYLSGSDGKPSLQAGNVP